ncbi:unnamed protein product [Blepharisma stoltei]|uniref:CD36 family protein n=1 Tax=Blepharisma stoltei TaxID=1481888 RepID=A0AAU9J363_9CILI|nr:unnamed protein product [Blepharisma stoltei]
MPKKPWVISGILGGLGLILILTAAIAPLIIDNDLKSQMKARIIMDDRSDHNLWGSLPGKSEIVLLHEYHFFDINNPEDVLKGALPSLTEQNGYYYQEFDDFLYYNYSSHHGTSKAWLRYFNYQRKAKTNHTVWRNDTHETDKITTVNLGPFGAWNTMKHSSPEKLALISLYQIIYTLNNDLAIAAYCQGIEKLLGNYTSAQNLIYDPAGINNEIGAEIWQDKYFGMGNWQTLQTWIKALEENLQNNVFVFPRPISGSLYLLQNNFGLNETQFEQIFTGEFKNYHDTVIQAFFNEYGCQETDGSQICDPAYLGALQWSASKITLGPPGDFPSQGSTIKCFNNTIYGYPEMSYFLSSTSTGEKYPGVSFTPGDYFELFYYDRVSGFPKWSNYTLLDVGHMNHFFALGREGLFSQIQADFNLFSENHALVLWDYINELVSSAALQGFTDQEIYNYDNRGIASEFSIGKLGSQALLEVTATLSDILLTEITATYDYLRLQYELGVTCEGILSDTLPSQTEICSIPQIQWSNDTTTMSYWLLPYWRGENSESWVWFQNITGLSDEEMETLYGNESTLVSNFTEFDSELKSHYSCINPGSACFSWDLSSKQWGNGYVTKNLPEIFSIFNIKNASSIYGLIPKYQPSFAYPPEYFSYIMTNNLTTDALSDEEIDLLLNFDYLFSSSQVQKLFIFDFQENYTSASEFFNLTDPETMANYIRFVIDKFMFGGIFRSKTVQELLWTDYDPFLNRIKNLNPLLGGDPSIDPSIVTFGKNQTRDMYEYIPLQFKNAINTGKTDIDQHRWYRLYGGVSYANIVKKQYFGESPWDSIINYVNYNPWDEEVDLVGGDSWGFQPDLDKDSKAKYYNQELAINFEAEYSKKVEWRGFNCLRFKLNSKAIQNSTQNPSHAKFYQFGPSGLINQTSALSSPIFAAKPYFLDADSMLDQLVTYMKPELNQPSEYNTVIDLEPYSGTPFYLSEKLMHTAELKPDALYPNLGKLSMENTGYRTYMPLMWVSKNLEISQHSADKYFGVINSTSSAIGLIKLLGFLFGAMLIAAMGMYLLRLYITTKRQKKAENPINGSQEILLEV